jgi:hypothetical protein
MIFKFLLGILLFLVLVYYFMLALQLWGVITFTNRPITRKGSVVPFYYWFK